MITFLIKHFLPSSCDPQSPDGRTAYTVFAGVTGIFCNIFLFLIKIITGVVLHSMAVTADAFNNLSDAASSIIGVIGAKMAGKPADEHHPFGHGRMEYIAALIVAFLILEVGINFFRASVDKVLHPEAIQISGIALVFLLISIAVKLWMFVFNRTLGKKTASKILKATATDSLFDAVTTTVTLVSILIYMLFDVNIDGIAGIFVSLIVIWAGIGIIRDTLAPLIGEQMDPEQYQEVSEIVREIPGVVSVHDLIIHSYGPDQFMATIHVEVPRDMSIQDAHTIADEAEKKVHKDTGIFLVVHTDPVETNDKRVLNLKQKVTDLLAILDPALSFHDFQAEFSPEQIRICFDLLLPYSYTPEQEEKLPAQIQALMQQIDPRYVCEINLDRGILQA